MLGSSLPASAYAHSSTGPPPATPSSPTRPSRLRGLSYLRNHTHRDSPPALPRTISSPAETHPVEVLDSAVAERVSASPAHQRQTDEGGWVPTVQGRPVMPRPRAATSVETGPEASETSPAVIRSRQVNGTSTGPVPSTSAPESSNRDSLPSIRLIPHVELRSSRPSLQFSAVSRTLKQLTNTVRVGRYSERDNIITPEGMVPPIGFKSKVVSRRHCEFWCSDGQWYIKDVKSSSGTFLNHVRLSAPGVESRPFPVNDGDVVQLGIDFKGGEELIFRCVKIRVECNRGWQKSLNTFNTSAHKRLFKNAIRTHNRDSDAASTHSSECSICLNPVEPCQALFVAPCSHVWHYKCIRNLIQGPNYPNFLCPNCRFVADLEADVEPPEFGDLAFQESDAESPPPSRHTPEEEHPNGERRAPDSDGMEIDMEDDDGDETSHLGSLVASTALSTPHVVSTPRPSPRHPERTTSNNNSQPVDIHLTPSHNNRPGSPSHHFLGPSAVVDGPMTPRNDAGPFVLDGGAASSGVSGGGATHALQSITGTGTGGS